MLGETLMSSKQVDDMACSSVLLSSSWVQYMCSSIFPQSRRIHDWPIHSGLWRRDICFRRCCVRFRNGPSLLSWSHDWLLQHFLVRRRYSRYLHPIRNIRDCRNEFLENPNMAADDVLWSRLLFRALASRGKFSTLTLVK
jgi:hypothetical protein